MEILTSAALPALVSGIVALVIARVQIRLKKRELENFSKDLDAREEALRQSQLLEVLRSRIQTYPILWKLIVSYTINWPYRRAERNSAWAVEFLREVDEWNADSGIFFSDSTYQRFKMFRSSLSKIARSLSEDEIVSRDQYVEIYRRFVGDKKARVKGLATLLKDDMGSYRVAALQASSDKSEALEPPKNDNTPKE